MKTQGTVIHGTLRNEDLIPAFLKELSDEDDYMEFVEQVPRGAWEDEGMKIPDESHPFWESGEASELVNTLMDAINSHVPEGIYFGNTEGDGSDFGYWPIDDEEEEEEEFSNDDDESFDEDEYAWDEDEEDNDDFYSYMESKHPSMKKNGKKHFTEEEGSDKYVVGLWPGSGYSLYLYGTYADSEDDALNNVVAYVVKKDESGLFSTSEELQKMMKDDKEDEMEDEEMEDEDVDSWAERNGFLYVDATMEGAPYPVYVYDQELRIEKVDSFGENVEVIGEELEENSLLFKNIYKNSRMREMDTGFWILKNERTGKEITDDNPRGSSGSPFKSKKEAEAYKLKRKLSDEWKVMKAPDNSKK